MIARIWQDLSKLFWVWYSQDRIWVSPVEGRVLRILPGDLITVAGIDATVIDRSIQEGSTGLSLLLKCDTTSGPGEMVITLTDSETPEIMWQEAGCRYHLTEDDIQVWPIKS